MNKISILGCGWLGLPLAKNLIEQGWSVKGSTTKIEKIEILENSGINGHLLNIDNEEELPESFFQSDVLFLNIPPANPDKMQKVKAAALANEISWVIVTSSTGIYPNLNGLVTENDASPNTTSRRGFNLSELEKIWLDSPLDSTILRFGGLYGPEREAGRFFQQKKSVPGGNSPVNMIHLEDCMGVINAILKLQIKNEILNACSPNHPPRKEFYAQEAEKLGLPLPDFNESRVPYKIVSNQRLLEKTGYIFKH